MNRVIYSWSAAVLVLCAGAWLVAPASWSPFAAAQEDAEEESREDGRPEELERRLDEIEELIERAEQRGDEAEIRELRREGERLLDRLEEIERARRGNDEEGEEEWEYEIREMEFHRLELEIERLRQELNAVQQESAIRLATIAENELTSASYAITQAIDHLGEEEVIDFLTELKQTNDDETIERIILHHLATLNAHMDRPDEARSALRALILRD